MNIAAIYNKYDLWGKVRVKFSDGVWVIWVDDVFNLQEKLDIKKIFNTYQKLKKSRGIE